MVPPTNQRRKATRPVDLPEDRREEREEAYKQWGISARRRGDLGQHTCTNQWNDRCFCETQEQYDRRTMNK